MPGEPLAASTTTAARRVLSEVFGFDAFRPGQEAAIGALLAGRNALTVMPTGSGKSLCFQIPALVMVLATEPGPDRPRLGGRFDDRHVH